VYGHNSGKRLSFSLGQTLQNYIGELKGMKLLISGQSKDLNIHLQNLKWPAESQKEQQSGLDEEKTSGIQTVHNWTKHVESFILEKITREL
jgi:hypothetical protein